MSHSLIQAGYHVRRSAKATDALRQVKAMRPDIVLLNALLPRLGRLEVCRRLKRDPETFNSGVIIVADRATETAILRGFAAGADDYISDPTSPGELSARIRAVLRCRKMARESDAEHHIRAGHLEIDRDHF